MTMKSRTGARVSKKAPQTPRSLSGLVKKLRQQPKPRQRIVDILAYAAVKHSHPARLAELTASERNARRRGHADDYNEALADSKAMTAHLADPDTPKSEKKKLDAESHAKMEKLLLAKIALTMDMLDIPETGTPEEDIFAIGMQCIGNVDTRFTPQKQDNADVGQSQKIALAQFFNAVLYDIKTEEILKGRYPDMQIEDEAVATPVLALANIYQSLFEIRMLGKKPTYRLKPDVFKNEHEAQHFENSLELVEAEFDLMNKKPETIKKMVKEGRALLDNKLSDSKNSLIGGLFKRTPGPKKHVEKEPKTKKPWI